MDLNDPVSGSTGGSGNGGGGGGGGGGEHGCTYPINNTCPTIAIDDDFTDEEEELTLQVLRDYATLFGDYNELQGNLALTEINQSYVDPSAYAYYESISQSITLPFGWYNAAIFSNQNGSFTISLAPPDLESILRFPSGSLQDESMAAKFVLTHGMTHAYNYKNPETLASFSKTVGLPIFASFSKNPIIKRNAGRPGFKSEVFSDAIAAFLYSPGLLNKQMSSWIQTTMINNNP
jgi:hypothetical protein